MTHQNLMALADAYANAVAQQGEAHDHIARDALNWLEEKRLKAAREKLHARLEQTK